MGIRGTFERINVVQLICSVKEKESAERQLFPDVLAVVKLLKVEDITIFRRVECVFVLITNREGRCKSCCFVSVYLTRNRSCFPFPFLCDGVVSFQGFITKRLGLRFVLYQHWECLLPLQILCKKNVQSIICHHRLAT